MTPGYFDPNRPVQPGQGSYYDMMLGLSDLGAKERGLDKQYALAEEMRGTPMPEMRSLGRVSRAAHPLEFLNTAIRQGMGMAGRSNAMKQQEELAKAIRQRIQEARGQSMSSGMPLPQSGPDMTFSPYQET